MGTHFLGGLNMRPVAVTDASSYDVLASNSGKIHAIPDLSQDIAIQLPAVENGLAFTFWYVGAAADASAVVIDAVATELFKGGVVFHDADIGGAGVEVLSVYADFSNDDKLTIDLPQVGTSITLVSDGVSWLTNGQVISATAPVFA
jgi:hypothetical protein